MFAINTEPPTERYTELLQSRAQERLAHRIGRAGRTAAPQERHTPGWIFGRALRHAHRPVAAARG